MNKIELFEQAKDCFEEYMCNQCSDEMFIAMALDFKEIRGHIAFKVKHELEDLLEHDKMSDALQDFCISVLAYRPEPLQGSYTRNYHSQWYEDDSR